MKVVSMRRKDGDAGNLRTVPGIYEGGPEQAFPHHLHFDDTDLERLGAGSARDGDEYEIHGKMKVHHSEEANGEKRAHLHITHLWSIRAGRRCAMRSIRRRSRRGTNGPQ